MNTTKKPAKKLKRGEWRRGSTRDFLELDDGHVGLVAIRMALAERIVACRKASGLTQAAVGELAGTTQSRVAKAEHASQEISLDLYLRVLIALGVNPAKLARALAG